MAAQKFIQRQAQRLWMQQRAMSKKERQVLREPEKVNPAAATDPEKAERHFVNSMTNKRRTSSHWSMLQLVEHYILHPTAAYVQWGPSP